MGALVRGRSPGVAAPVHTSPPPAWAAGSTPPPFVWDEERRARLRAELDALYAHLYGLTREELAYILETFPIVRRKDEARWGEYRTKRMVLEKYEGWGGGITEATEGDEGTEGRSYRGVPNGV